MRDSYLIKQEISSANALPSLCSGIVLVNRGGFGISMGRYSDAEPLYLRTVEIFLKCLGEDHPNTQTAFGNFRYLLQQALANNSTASLSDHPLTQQLLQQLRA